MSKDKKENYIKEGSEREKKTLGDLIDDIYNKINFLRDEISDIKDHAIKLTLQGNKIFQMLNDDKGEITISKIKKLEDFDKDFYLEYIQNIIFILDEAIENEDWELVSEAKNLLENEEFEDFVDDDIF